MWLNSQSPARSTLPPVAVSAASAASASKPIAVSMDTCQQQLKKGRLNAGL
jgi:hypothetical protein